MSCFAHYASRRIAAVEPEFAHARYIVAPALLWAAAIVALVVATVLQDTPATAPAQTVSPAEVPVVPFGA